MGKYEVTVRKSYTYTTIVDAKDSDEAAFAACKESQELSEGDWEFESWDAAYMYSIQEVQ